MIFLTFYVAILGIYGTSGTIQLIPPNYNASSGSSVISFVCSDPESSSRFFSVNGASVDQAIQDTRGVAINTLNSTTSRITFQPLLINNNITVNCLTVLPEINQVEGVLLVQGTLSAPSDPVISVLSPGQQQLSWGAPFTIDLTDQDPDILGYRVCYSMTSSSSSSIPMQCSITSTLTYSFLNVRLLLNFSIAAINPAGEGNISYVTHSPCASGE